MIYKNTSCPGCGRMLKENDDVVVCPECATPQHRECYEKENKCVNTHLHAEGYEWKNEGTAEKAIFFKKKDAPDKKDTDSEFSPCPNCGNMNPKGTKQCSRCGMKLVVFGIDLATEIKQQNNPQQENKSIPTYNAPFTLGEGEGFTDENKDELQPDSQAESLPEADKQAVNGEEASLSDEAKPEEIPTPEQIGSSIIDAIQSTGHREYFDSYIDSVHVNLIANMVGTNAYKYIDKFKAMENGKKFSFNWAAFFFTPYWFFYRKLYKPGIIILTFSMLLSILITPSMLEISNTMMSFLEGVSEEMMMDEAFLNEFMGTYLQGFLPIFLYSTANFIISLISGFMANKLYKKYIINSSKLVMKARSKPEAGNLIARLGGVSPIALLAAYLGAQLISSLASYLMF
ncbi:MAG: RING finger protein [Acutalibacteraceae bacterium]|nr:RING finger protein [Acutalibacteraceae bacterium]